jgi:outer membrane protein assembly factor BamE (lipoprotein component of BamABCDE complex)
MNLAKLLAPVVLVGFLCACGTPGGHIKAGDPSVVTIGMSKDQVIQKLGRPENATAEGNTEYLNYILERPWWQDKPFRVKIVDGKVVSYEVVEH